MAGSSKLKVLVVEDEALIAMLLEDWLQELGCEPVGPAVALEEALDLIATRSLDAAIIDVSLGGGRESYPAAEALKARAVPFAFATGHHSGVVDERFPGTPVLTKPYDFAAVKRIVTGWSVAGAPGA